MPLRRVASVLDLREGKGIVVDADDKRIALFRDGGDVFALDETCPHRGGPLHEGLIRDGVVACPWHLWRFDLRSGCSPVNPLSKVRTYPARIEGDDVLVDLEEGS